MIEIKRAKGKQPYYFVVKGKNGKILVTSETCARKASVYKATYAVKLIFLQKTNSSTKILVITDKTLKTVKSKR